MVIIITLVNYLQYYSCADEPSLRVTIRTLSLIANLGMVAPFFHDRVCSHK